MPRQIFRKEALARLSSPEQLDQLLRVTSPRGWLVLAALGLVLLGALLWGIFGSVPITAEGEGFLMRSEGVKPVTAPRKGVVAAAPVHVGQKVEEGQTLVEFAPADPPARGATTVACPFPARVLSLAVKDGDAVNAGDHLLTLEPLNDPLVAVLYVPASEGYKIETDMPAQVWPASVIKGESAPLIGQVLSAAKFPTGPTEMARRLQNEDLANSLAKGGPYLEVVVELPERSLYSGTPCHGEITLRDRRPIQLVFPTPNP